MNIPAWRTLQVKEGVLVEPIAENDRLVLWLAGSHDGGFRLWDRISTVPRAEVVVNDGLCATMATSVATREQVKGVFGKLWKRLRGSAGDGTWMLPTGMPTQQCGERKADLLLVWAEDASNPPDETQIMARWPAADQVRALGKNLFVVSGVDSPASHQAPSRPLLQGTPREVAEQLMAAAREQADVVGQASALSDLGAILLQEGNLPEAQRHLEDALNLATQMQNHELQRDIFGNLGTAALKANEPQMALEYFLQEQNACVPEDRWGAKTAFNHLALAYAHLRDPATAIEHFEFAASMAQELGDRPHEADLLWQLAIIHAELGERDQALMRGQMAIAVLEPLGKPQVRILTEHLRKYRQGDPATGLAEALAAESAATSDDGQDASFAVGAWEPQENTWTGPAQTAGNPGLLRMAFSASKSLAKYLGSGLKKVPAKTHEKRLRTCATCEHHTGVRCKLCGCFTAVKAWMPHEECPIKKWPAV